MTPNQPKKLSNKKLTECVGYLQSNDRIVLDYIVKYIEFKGDTEPFKEHLKKLAEKKQ